LAAMDLLCCCNVRINSLYNNYYSDSAFCLQRGNANKLI
jgi:hypothetical protein